MAAFIRRKYWRIAQEASRILADEIVTAENEVWAVARLVPEVLGCHQIRTRGQANCVFVDLHV